MAERTTLSPKEKRVLDFWFGEANFNKAKAMVMAGYSAKTARQAAQRMFTKVYVLAEIKRRFDETEMSDQETAHHIADLARGVQSLSIFFEQKEVKKMGKGGNEYDDVIVLLNEEAVDKYSHLIKSISWTAHGPKIEFYDRLKALELMGKHHEMFSSKVVHSWRENTPDDVDPDEMVTQFAGLIQKAAQQESAINDPED